MYILCGTLIVTVIVPLCLFFIFTTCILTFKQFSKTVPLIPYLSRTFKSFFWKHCQIYLILILTWHHLYLSSFGNQIVLYSECLLLLSYDIAYFLNVSQFTVAFMRYCLFYYYCLLEIWSIQKLLSVVTLVCTS